MKASFVIHSFVNDENDENPSVARGDFNFVECFF